jgi:hypothetical protein
MLATLYALLCAANICTTHVVAEMPFHYCMGIQGQSEAMQYAEKNNQKLTMWKCAVGRRA